MHLSYRYTIYYHASFVDLWLILSLSVGNVEVDVDQFADHDEKCHGPMDTDENRRDFPEGLHWNFCEG